MKQVQFIPRISEALGIEEKTIRMIVRSLRDAGLFTTGARGVNAPDLTPLDAVRVFIAAVASESPSRAPTDVLYFGSLVPDFSNGQPNDTAKIGIEADTTLEQTLLAVAEGRASYSACFWGSLDLQETGRAMIYSSDSVSIYQEFYRAGSGAAHLVRRQLQSSPIRRIGQCPLQVLHDITAEMVGREAG